MRLVLLQRQELMLHLVARRIEELDPAPATAILMHSDPVTVQHVLMSRPEEPTLLVTGQRFTNGEVKMSGTSLVRALKQSGIPLIAFVWSTEPVHAPWIDGYLSKGPLQSEWAVAKILSVARPGMTAADYKAVVRELYIRPVATSVATENPGQ